MDSSPPSPAHVPFSTRDTIIECVLNVSEGRCAETLTAIRQTLEALENAALLDFSADVDHHRSVFTFAGTPTGVERAARCAVAVAVERIDLRRHHGLHPRIGAADVVPFVPLHNAAMEECVALARRLGQEVAETLGVPVYLYGEAARDAEHASLAAIRQGGFEGLSRRIADGRSRRPDYGPSRLHERAGASVFGARLPLTAFNVYLESAEIAAARHIASQIREAAGGLPGVRALGLFLPARGQVQVSMNLTDSRLTRPIEAFQRIRRLASGLGISISSSQLIGLIPRDALGEGDAEVMKIESFDEGRILENRIARVLNVEI